MNYELHRKNCSCGKCMPMGIFEYVFHINFKKWAKELEFYDLGLLLVILIFIYFALGFTGVFLALTIFSISFYMV